MNDVDRQIVEHVVLGVDLPSETLRRLDELSDLGVAALALGAAPGVLDAWYRSVDAPSRIEMLALLQVERDEVADRVDSMLDGEKAPRVASDLVRASIPWDHPRLVELLDEDEDDASFSAAWLLVSTASPELEVWLRRCDVAESAADVLRAAALLGIDEYWDVAEQWRNRIADVEEMVVRFDTLLAMMSPMQFARGLFGGSVNSGWLSHPVHVADFIQSVGYVSWIEPLGILDLYGSDDAFEFAAALGVSASAAAAHRLLEEVDEESLVDVLTGEADWESLANTPEMGMAVALGEGEELQQLFVEVAVHERLIQSGAHSPGIPGLPLSATTIDAERIGATELLLRDMCDVDDVEGGAVVGAVRTLCDLAFWHARNPEYVKSLIPLADELTGHEHPAVSAAARRALGEVFEIESGVEEDCSALLGVEEHVAEGESGLDTLVELWATGPVARAETHRNALFEAFEHVID